MDERVTVAVGEFTVATISYLRDPGQPRVVATTTRTSQSGAIVPPVPATSARSLTSSLVRNRNIAAQRVLLIAYEVPALFLLPGFKCGFEGRDITTRKSPDAEVRACR